MDNKVWEYIKYNGGYDQRFMSREGPGNHRFSTFKTAISLFLQRNGCKTIVETGCQRAVNDWGAGCSSLIFAETLNQFPEKGILCSIDLSLPNLQTCYECIKHVDNQRFQLIHGDSVNALRGINEVISGPIGLLFLDSLDLMPQDFKNVFAQTHQLNELKMVYNSLDENSVILLDDNGPFPDGGKTELAKKFLIENDWKCVIDYDQTLWLKNI